MVHTRFSKVWLAAALCIVVSFSACGGSKQGEAPPSPSAPASAGFDSPRALLQALSAAVNSGDESTVRALYDPSAPDAAKRIAWWSALARACATWEEARKAYVAKFGQAAWDAPENRAAWAWETRDEALSHAVGADWPAANLIEVKGDEAQIPALKFKFTVLRSDGAWRHFREETLGNEGDDPGEKLASDVSRFVKECSSPAEFLSRYNAR
jgi:hypothetical protein